MPGMDRRDKLTVSRKMYAVDLDSLRTGRQPGYTGAMAINAVWFRRRSGLTVACVGTLWDNLRDQPVRDGRDFLEKISTGRYGGDCLGRWNGTSYYGHRSTLADQERHLAVLRPMLENYPAIPPGYDGWYAFRPDA